MARRIFLTGASGFLGREVFTRLTARGHEVTGLARRPSADGSIVAGDLRLPETFERHLIARDIVVHLAAVTGKAAPEDYEEVNVGGTQALIEAATRAGVPRFLFYSTIAAKFPDLRRYFYALSKVQGERLVQASGLATTIIRPTIIAGAESPVMGKLAELARLPAIPAFGGARASIQPILVQDLADFVVDIVDEDRFRGEILELGGPERLTVRELLDRCHRRANGRPARFVPVPLGPLLPVLSVLEQVAYGAMPLTIGQLATFRFDGVADPNGLWESRRNRLASVDRMLAAIASA